MAVGSAIATSPKVDASLGALALPQGLPPAWPRCGMKDFFTSAVDPRVRAASPVAIGDDSIEGCWAEEQKIETTRERKTVISDWTVRRSSIAHGSLVPQR